MASASYSTQVIVLKKTKLGESDLILSLLATDGSQLRAVAKGARKPSNSFASRLELYSCAEILCSRGRNLDIVKEARLITGNEKLRSEIEYTSGAAPITELLDKITQNDLEEARLFDMTKVAFSTLCSVEVDSVPSITAAHLLKTLAFAGLRPSFDACAVCGSNIKSAPSGELLAISYREGGLLCPQCDQTYDTIMLDADTIAWSKYLLSSPFAQIAEEKMSARSAFAVLHFCQSWIREHWGIQLKSMKFLLTNGLF